MKALHHSFMKRINQFFLNLEWRLALGATLWAAVFPAGSFALPIWAARAAGLFSDYAPLSWVACGFLGFLCYALGVAFIGFGRWRSVRSKYDSKFMKETGGIDPLSKAFEGKRIYLNDLVLPTNMRVVGKTFVGCEIVGPSNMYLEHNNNINKNESGAIDAIALSGKRTFSNGISFVDCVFKDCTFHRVSLFFNPSEVYSAQNINWLNWITPLPPQITKDLTIAVEDHTGQSNEGNGEEKQR